MYRSIMNTCLHYLSCINILGGAMKYQGLPTTLDKTVHEQADNFINYINTT